MYFVVKYNRITNERIVLKETEDAEVAYSVANWCDAECKVGYEEDDRGEVGASVTIEDENGADKWQECASISCPPVGMFN